MKRLHPDALLSPSLAILIAVGTACLAYFCYVGGAAVRDKAVDEEYSLVVTHGPDGRLLAIDTCEVEAENCEPPAVFDADWSEEFTEDAPIRGQGTPTLAPPQKDAEEPTAHYFNRPQGRAIAIRIEAASKDDMAFD